jgi:carboxymethylenebutenolidase
VDVAHAALGAMAEDGVTGVGVVGFCFGGGRVVDVLAALSSIDRTQLQADDSGRTDAARPEESGSPCDSRVLGALDVCRCGIAFYGTRIDCDALAAVVRPVGLFFAGDDPLVPGEELEKIRRVAEGCDVEVVVHVEAGAAHGFVHQRSVAVESGERGEKVLGRGVEYLKKHLYGDDA